MAVLETLLNGLDRLLSYISFTAAFAERFVYNHEGDSCGVVRHILNIS
jgi:hypothetical protein